MKDIAKIVLCHQWFNCNVMKLREYFLYPKKTKITTLFNNSSPPHLLRVSVAAFWRISTGRKLRTLFCVSHTTWIRCFRSNQSVNKLRRCIRVVRLTQNCVHSLCPGNIFHTFLGLDGVIYLAVNGTVTSLPVFIQNILNCVPKTNEAFTGLERHGGGGGVSD